MDLSKTKPLGSFRYSEEYRKNEKAFRLDEGQLSSFRSIARATAYQGLHDIFKDVKPEGFGLDMLRRNRGVTSLSNIDALEYSPGDAVGAIEICENIEEKICFAPHSSQEMFDAMDALDPAQSSAHVVNTVEGSISTSLGGERPKMTVLHEGQQWIAKFAGRADDPTSTLREFICMRLASICDIDVADVQYVHRNDRGAILIRRFDRHMLEDGGCNRVHFASAATVLGAANAVNDSPQRTYIGLAMMATRWKVTGHQTELWRRMVFNGLVGNGDDHPRNHGFLRTEHGWKLSPAYDIAPYTPSGGKVQEVPALSMGLRRSGDAGVTADNMLVGAKQLGITYAEANDYLDFAYETIRDTWDTVAVSVGQKPLEPPLFKLPPRAERISEGDWKRVRA
ncbi:type II toxin-antitoxin system HipA family toxin [Comamonas testosteroni]|uniref:type II toxin-antitoxin system HipA family toxin n=1 Tax=Comamonas testosteroni TaxID=285 RepID=UPI0018B012BB|nr:type II toxin-antitoxin system HipA family toxin [Comamonas testosteroni]